MVQQDVNHHLCVLMSFHSPGKTQKEDFYDFDEESHDSGVYRHDWCYE